MDACQNATTSTDHYAPVFLALALHSSGERGAATRVLDHWASIPPRHRGHQPFNRLRLGLMAQLEEAGDHPVVAAHHPLCPLRRRYLSNNWSLLIRALRVREAYARDNRWEARIPVLVEALQTAHGPPGR